MRPEQVGRGKMASGPTPDLIDHFPLTAPGHGRGIGRGKGAPLCGVPQCERVSRTGRGQAHECGRAKNAAEWMRAVRYTGPDVGISAAPPERDQADITRVVPPRAGCHERCQEIGRHSTCLIPAPFRVPLLARMIQKIDQLPPGRQSRLSRSRGA